MDVRVALTNVLDAVHVLQDVVLHVQYVEVAHLHVLDVQVLARDVIQHVLQVVRDVLPVVVEHAKLDAQENVLVVVLQVVQRLPLRFQLHQQTVVFHAQVNVEDVRVQALLGQRLHRAQVVI